jgi:hypothetical protein
MFGSGLVVLLASQTNGIWTGASGRQAKLSGVVGTVSGIVGVI